MDLYGGNIQPVTNKYQEAYTVAETVGEEAISSFDSHHANVPIGYSLVIPFGNDLYYFDGAIIWKTQIGSGVPEKIWQYTSHTNVGNQDYIYGYSYTEDQRQEVSIDTSASSFWIDQDRMIIGVTQQETTWNGNTGFFSGETLVECYVFSVLDGQMRKTEDYSSIANTFRSVLKNGMVSSWVQEI